MERPNYTFEVYSDPGYTIIGTKIDSNKKDIFVSLKAPNDYKTSIPELVRIK